MARLLDIKKGLAKKYGNATFEIGDITRIPFNVFIFDYITGGGIPENRSSLLWGPKSTTKTTSALRIIDSFLTKNKNKVAAFADFERTFDKKWAAHYIKDMGRLHAYQPEYGEEGIDITKEILTAEDIGLLIVDSLAEIVPAKEYEDDASVAHVGLISRLQNKLFRVLSVSMAQAKSQNRNLTVVYINQPTVIMGGGKKFGPMSKPMGAGRQGLIASMELKFTNKGYVKKGETPYLVKNAVTVEKNKVGLAKRTGEFGMYLIPHNGHAIGDVDEMTQVVEYAKRTGVIERTGTKWQIGTTTFPNLTAISTALSEDKKAFEAVRTATLGKLVGGLYLTDGDGKDEAESSDD